jgi:isoleucyl-tRNA synthetase
VNQLSSFYLDVIKDRMYCEAPDSMERRSGQFACRKILLALTKLVAPILCHTAEEIWTRLGHSTSVHLETFDVPSPGRLAEIEGSALQTRFAALLEIRSEAFVAWEQFKQGTDLKDSQDAILSMTTNSAEIKDFSQEMLATYLKMSWVEVAPGEPSYVFRASDFLKCERSRLRRPDVEVVDGVPLTARDRRVVQAVSA